MYFEKSENIARKAQDNEYAIEDVEKLDEYLAHPNHTQFTLYDVKSNTRLGDNAERIVREYVRAGILSEPKKRHLCPVHDIVLEVVNLHSGQCIDCENAYLLADCPTETVFARLENPDKWPPTDSNISILQPEKPDIPWWRSDRFKIACFTVAVASLLGLCNILITVYLHFNPASPPVPLSTSLTASTADTTAPGVSDNHMPRGANDESVVSGKTEAETVAPATPNTSPVTQSHWVESRSKLVSTPSPALP